MQLINPEVTKYPYATNPIIKVETIGRVCYKSDSKYTMETAIKFIESLISRGHLSVLEHASFVFKVDDLSEYPYKFVNKTTVFDSDNRLRTLYSTNLRAIIENKYTHFMVPILEKYPSLRGIFESICPSVANANEEDYLRYIKLIDLREIKDITQLEINNHFYTTFEFLTDRGVTHEMVRHRIASFTQESTRYCNYSKEKFGNEIRCIKPANYGSWSIGNQITYEQSLRSAEKAYLALIKEGATPQQARGVLPTDLATTIIMSANHEEWEHFFDLRSRAKTGAPHPNMKVVASKAEELYYSPDSMYTVINRNRREY